MDLAFERAFVRSMPNKGRGQYLHFLGVPMFL
jgi:hypothetical protein